MHVCVRELERITGGRLRCDHVVSLGAPVTGRVVTDSRTVEPGDLFWALPGTVHDGADYIGEAIARGACGVVTERQGEADPSGCTWRLEVKDALQALWATAGWYRRGLRGKSIAVTGSVGKTTTRNMIHTVLSTRLAGRQSLRNYNNQVGVPLSLLSADPLDDYGVWELAASAPGEIGPLAELAAPEIGVLTTIGDAHLAGFGSVRTVAATKGELLERLPSSGWAVLNGDDPWQQRMARRTLAQVVRVGRGGHCDLVATDVNWQPGQLEFTLDGLRFGVPVWGRHHLTSCLAAIAVADKLGLPRAAAAAGLASYQPLPGRCHIRRLAGMTVIDDCYNANPCSQRAALELLREMGPAGRKVVLTGDMLELGQAADEKHYELGEHIAYHCGAQLLIACGEYAEKVAAGARAAGMLPDAIVTCSDALEAADQIEGLLTEGDVLLVKGSRRMRLERVIERLTSTASVPIPGSLFGPPIGDGTSLEQPV